MTPSDVLKFVSIGGEEEVRSERERAGPQLRCYEGGGGVGKNAHAGKIAVEMGFKKTSYLFWNART